MKRKQRLARSNHEEIDDEPTGVDPTTELLLETQPMATSMNFLTTQQLYDELSIALAEGDIDDALAQLDVICRVHPDHGGAWELRGLLQAQAGRPNLAVRYFERASALVSLEVWSSRVMALQYLAIGHRQTAVGLDLHLRLLQRYRTDGSLLSAIALAGWPRNRALNDCTSE